MTRRISIWTIAVFSTAFLATWTARGGDDKPADAKPPAKHAGFEKIKALAGDWLLADKPNDPPYCSYRVVSGGSAVMEELMPAGESNMITMYHLDGDALVMTHYCGLGNQPRMKAKPASGNKIDFEFAGGCNVDPKGKYMSALSLEFVDADHIKAHWTLTDNGKKGEQATFDLIRRKKA